ncbi:hypothetical protein PENTCL1PPCAC_11747, partial [Pristionchus entomophagus]
MSFEKLRFQMRPLLTISLLVCSVHSHWVDEQLSDVIQPENDDVWSTLQKIRDFSIPNFKGCEQTKACYIDLLTSTGFSSDPFPNYADYLANMTDSYGSGQALSNYCGSFYAVSNCYSLESDSCRSPTVFATLFNLTNDDAYRFSSDLDLRKIMCDNQQALADPCMNKMTKVKRSIPVENDATVSCDTVAADFSAVMSKTNDDCPASVQSVYCQITTKTKEIETIGACDGKIPPCPTTFHSCDNMKICFDTFYDAVKTAGVKTPLPDYSSYASNMKRLFENEDGIGKMCSYQSSLHACILRHANKNCPINAASFRSMFNMNYEQAYDYSTDFNLRKEQCINQEGVRQRSCLYNATLLLNMCKPSIPHNLSLGRACTDLRLAMKCDNFAVRQYCPDEARKMYCITQEIIYQQGALGFCDGWMPHCNEIIVGNGTDTTDEPQPDTTTDGGLLPTLKKLANLSLPNLGGCEQTKGCFINLLTSTGFSSD